MAPYGPPQLLGAAIALPVFSVIAVGLRFYVRLFARKVVIGIDDWLILFVLPLAIGQNICQILSAIYGAVGREDYPYVAPNRIAYQDKLYHAILVIEKVNYTTIKLSVLFFYRRIFGISNPFRIVNNVLIGLIIAWGLAFLFADAFACASNGSGIVSCGAQQWILLWFAITEVVGDIAILSLPYPCIRRLQLDRKDKIGVAAVFALGTISVMMGVIRLGYVSASFHRYFHPNDKTKGNDAPLFWTSAQVSIGIVAACLPSLSPLIRRSKDSVSGSGLAASPSPDISALNGTGSADARRGWDWMISVQRKFSSSSYRWGGSTAGNSTQDEKRRMKENGDSGSERSESTMLRDL